MATLKISDLSVGDWVEFHHIKGVYISQPFFDKAIAQVIGTHRGGEVTVLVDGKREFFAIPLSAIQPIPITPEILEANGFEPPRVGIGLDTWFWSNKRDMALELRRYVNDKWHLAYQIKDKAQAHLLFPLYHIHELQHIIRLLHIDKDIVMPNK